MAAPVDPDLKKAFTELQAKVIDTQQKEVIHNQLLEKQKVAEENIKELEQKKSYLERSVKEAKDNMREMLMA
ncbi:hypothetical protein U0070_024073 [Myodes glareolus]|uniref:Prefoldin subunit 6 n=1 Tax=Myodes glareolus TaxID=447135 RepID=A0AAW0HUE0_MYOGA